MLRLHPGAAKQGDGGRDVVFTRKLLTWALPGSALVVGLSSVAVLGGAGSGTGQTQIPATIEDFFHPGTQPDPTQSFDPFFTSNNCQICHGQFDFENPWEPYDSWVGSMMGQSARDPIWHAALAIANQDVENGGDSCIRCHAPNAWLSGRSTPTDGSAFIPEDFDGVTCHVCHRLVDPVEDAENPVEDGPILKALDAEGLVPQYAGNAQYIVDPMDSRRGPFDDIPQNMHAPAPILVSPYHRESQLCGTCHDVSNPVYTRQPDGTYELNSFDVSHPTQNPQDMMPEQRTFSEWLNSEFAVDGVQLNGRFGGNHPTGVMRSCQDCHMPDRFAGACFASPFPPFFLREDMPHHAFAGANTWVIRAIEAEYGFEAGLDEIAVQNAEANVEEMLTNASDLLLRQEGHMLRTRIVNYSGHKLPTGYPEGRRMWVNVRFFDEEGLLIAEHGVYDDDEATLNEDDTKVYEMQLGIDETVSELTGVPAGKSFHLLLNNMILFDNRIPPIGFTNASFEAIRAQPVAYTYEDGQYWDDTLYPVPRGASQAVVNVFYQTTTREYIEFLRDENVTNDAGQYAYDLWVEHGKSAPALMDSQVIDLGDVLAGDVNANDVVNIDDAVHVLNAWGPCPPPAFCAEDLVVNEVVNIDDLFEVLNNYGAMQ